MPFNISGGTRPHRVTSEFILDSGHKSVYESTGGAYSTGDTALPRATYETITGAYPALVAHPRAATFRRLVRYLLFSTFKDNAGRVIVPYVALQKIARVRDSNHRFHAGRLLDEFSDAVWPLTVSAPRHWKGEARTVEGCVPDSVQAALDAAIPDPDSDRMWLGAGKGVTHAGARRAGKQYEMEMRAFASDMTETHPARELLAYLNGLPSTCLSKRIEANWQSLMAAWEAMPKNSDQERARRRQAQGILLHVRDYPEMVYATSARTPRAFAMGQSVNGLPRDLRKIALRGCVEMDARACQLAIVARLWELPTLTTFLETRRSVWGELTDYLGLDANVYKPTVKRLVYGIVFGAQEVSLRRWMRDGDDGILPLAPEQADGFLGHRLVCELLAGRNERLRQIRRDKFVVDAFGQRREYDGREVRHRSLLAQEVQSHEVSLMLSLLPRIQRNHRDVHIVSWLHDGLSLWFSDKAKAASTVRLLCGDFSRAAEAGGFLTEMEVGEPRPFNGADWSQGR